MEMPCVVSCFASYSQTRLIIKTTNNTQHTAKALSSERRSPVLLMLSTAADEARKSEE
jgi:hypothetical protein